MATANNRKTKPSSTSSTSSTFSYRITGVLNKQLHDELELPTNVPIGVCKTLTIHKQKPIPENQINKVCIRYVLIQCLNDQ